MVIYSNEGLNIKGSNNNPTNGLRTFSRTLNINTINTTTAAIVLTIGASNPALTIGIDFFQCGQIIAGSTSHNFNYGTVSFDVTTSGVVTINGSYPETVRINKGVDVGTYSFTTNTRLINFNLKSGASTVKQTGILRIICNNWDYLTVSYP